MPAIRFTEAVPDWKGREIPAGTRLNVTLEEAKELKRLKVAEDDKPEPAPDMSPPASEPEPAPRPASKPATQKDEPK